MKRKLVILFFVLGLISQAVSQSVYRKVLFLGNSYTFVNDLPLLASKLASSSGDSLFYDSNTPGGYTLGWQPVAHSTDATSLGKIAQDGWDFVVLQEQSQTPAIPALRDSCMYPASVILHDSVRSANPCSRVLFFLTWGRRFGGIQCFTQNYCSPDFADFDQMQDSLTTAYKGVAWQLGDWIAPVGEAWRFAIDDQGMVLHSGDGSHPNLKGSYLAACVFYDVIFGKRSYGLAYQAGLADTALMLQMAADTVVFGDPASWNLWDDQPVAGFEPIISSDTLFTDNLSIRSSIWHWDFGDGQTSGDFEPVHVYSSAGAFNVSLTACDSCRCDTVSRTIVISWTGSNFLHKDQSGRISVTSDQHGNLRLNGYQGSGNIEFHDMTGRLVRTVRIGSCIPDDCDLPGGFYLWILSDLKGNKIAAGKMLR